MVDQEKNNEEQLKTINEGFRLLGLAIAESTRDIKEKIPGFNGFFWAAIFFVALLPQCTTNPINDKVTKAQNELSEIKTSMADKKELAKVQKQLSEVQNLLANMQMELAEIKSQTAPRPKSTK